MRFLELETRHLLKESHRINCSFRATEIYIKDFSELTGDGPCMVGGLLNLYNNNPTVLIEKKYRSFGQI